MPRWSIAVAGAGTAGLAVAAFLKRSGHDVRIFERFAEPKPLGAGLMIQPTGLACLAALGVDEQALALGQTIDGIRGHTVEGKVIFDIGYREIGPHVTSLAMNRAALFDVLLRAVSQAAVPIVGGCEIASSRTEGDKRVLVDASGTTHGPFDLVIDGTGTRSTLRAREGAVRLNRPYPYGALWTVLKLPPDWPDRRLLAQRYDGAHTMTGILPIGRRPDGPQELAAFFWSLRTADVAAWRATGLGPWKKRVTHVWPALQPFLDQINSPDDLTSAHYADIWLRRPHAERLVFIGDAARSASPQLGQGANLALIDALVLSRMLDAHPTIPAALDAFADARRAHTRFYGLASRLLTPFFQSDSRVAGFVRDLTFKPMAYVPYLRREMVRTLSGMKTGLFTHLDPGTWHPRYALAATEPATPLQRTPT
jgi:salicylate hydroxylase